MAGYDWIEPDNDGLGFLVNEPDPWDPDHDPDYVESQSNPEDSEPCCYGIVTSGGSDHEVDCFMVTGTHRTTFRSYE